MRLKKSSTNSTRSPLIAEKEGEQVGRNTTVYKPKEQSLDDLSALSTRIMNDIHKAAQGEREGSKGLLVKTVEFHLKDLKRLPLLVRDIMQTADDLDCREEVEAILQKNDRAAELAPKIRPRDFSDAGNAEVFATLYSKEMLYCDALGWLVWDEKRWAVDKAAAQVNALQLTDAMLHAAKDAFSQDEDSFFLKHAQRTRNKPRIDAMMALAESWLSKPPTTFDADPCVLNTPDGIVNLETGEITPNRRTAFCTCVTGCGISDVGEDEWLDFLRLITCNDDQLAKYLQMAIGCAAFGEVRKEGMFIAIGSGRNGKSTFFNAIAAALGDYSGTIVSDALITTHTRDNSPYLATLRGKRLILTGELAEGARLSESTVKQITSTDEIQIKRLYHDPEKIKPSHTTCMFTNFLPRIGSTDNGIWRRLVVLPFNAIMPTGNKEIVNYADHLFKECGGAILKWIIEGAMEFAKNGNHLPPCDVVDHATTEYRDRENWLRTFIEERCDKGDKHEIAAGKLFEAYRQYAKDTGDFPRKRADFNSAMELAGFKQRTIHGGGKVWHGLCLSDQYTYYY